MKYQTLKGIVIATLLIAFGYSGIASAEESTGGAFAKENFSATLTFTTDYTYRGTTFSTNESAIQGSFDWAYGDWFIGMWGTSANNINLDEDTGDVIDAGGTLEIDYYAGWFHSWGNGIETMIMPLLYTFPGQNGSNARDDTTFELWTSIGYGFANVRGEPYLNLAVNWSNEYFEGGDDSFYYNPSVTFTLPADFGIVLAYGYLDVGGEGENPFFADDYSHWEVALTKSFKGFDFDLRYHENDDRRELDEFADSNFALDNDLVLSIARSF